MLSVVLGSLGPEHHVSGPSYPLGQEQAVGGAFCLTLYSVAYNIVPVLQ